MRVEREKNKYIHREREREREREIMGQALGTAPSKIGEVTLMCPIHGNLLVKGERLVRYEVNAVICDTMGLRSSIA